MTASPQISCSSSPGREGPSTELLNALESPHPFSSLHFVQKAHLCRFTTQYLKHRLILFFKNTSTVVFNIALCTALCCHLDLGLHCLQCSVGGQEIFTWKDIVYRVNHHQCKVHYMYLCQLPGINCQLAMLWGYTRRLKHKLVPDVQNDLCSEFPVHAMHALYAARSISLVFLLPSLFWSRPHQSIHACFARSIPLVL